MKRVFTLLLLACCLLIAPAAAAGGSGTVASPYIIETAAELQSIQNNLAAHYKLANDIDLSGVTWSPIGSSSAPFVGSLDGNNYKISNLRLESTGHNIGLFGVVGTTASFKDITIVDFNIITSDYFCSCFIGHVININSNQFIINNVDLMRCSLTSTSENQGLLIGYVGQLTNSLIHNCDISHSYLSSEGQRIGGIAGQIQHVTLFNTNHNTITNTIFFSNSYSVGGIVGHCFVQSPGVVNIEYNTISSSIISTINTDVGGIVGRCDYGLTMTISNNIVDNCILSSGSYVGGVIGRGLNGASNLNILNNMVTSCTISASSTYAGGVLSWTQAITTIDDCEVVDTIINSNSYAAGICPAYS